MGLALALANKPGGILAHYGLLSGQSLPLHLGRPTPGVVRPFWLWEWVHSASREELKAAMTWAFEDISSGLASTAIEARYDLADVHTAIAHRARAGRWGKSFSPRLPGR